MKQLIKEVNSGFTADGNGQKTPGPAELHDREWRADPSDGLRPLLHIRKSFHG
jgi:N-acetylneuraminate synthase